jgi:hydrogenase-4 component B
VKAFGVGFLARPRSVAAEQAREAHASMRTAMVIGALSCGVVAVAPVWLGETLRRVLAAIPAGHQAGLPRLDATLRLPGIAGSIAPGWLAVSFGAALVVAMALGSWGVRRRPATAASPLWACGADELSPRMQYTATSFAEPLQRVFDDVLRPETDIQVSHHAESRYLVEKVAYRSRLRDAVEERLYTPVLQAVTTLSAWVRRAHSGSVHAYLSYGAVGVLAVFLLAR